MQSSRDSSVWRSLAVAFGDGLAFGVGMKLTQPAGHTPVDAPQTDLNPLARRLEEMEQRIAEIGTRPVALAPPEKVAIASQPFDQKVLEAVVNALEARLREHASQVERQITELQAKITIELNTLDRQDRAVAERAQASMAALQEQIGGELSAIRHAVEADRRNLQDQLGNLHHDVASVVTEQLDAIRKTADADRQDLQAQLGNLHNDVADVLSEQLDGIRKTAEADRQNVEDRIGNLHHDIADVLSEQMETLQQQLRDEIRQSAGNIAALAASAADAAADNRLAPLRTALAAKDLEIVELRARLESGDRATLDLLQGVGEICRRAAERYTRPEEPAAPQIPEEPAAPAPAESVSETDVPGFAQTQPPGKLWRVPLVSSLVLTTGAMVMMHFV
jgi:hypothetical protein